MWNGKRISLVFPTYREKDSIRQAIEDAFATGIVDEVIVVNNNAEPGTSDEVAGTGAIEIFETRQGYGWAIRAGLQAATGELIAVSEPDGTFRARDLVKMAAFSEDFDVVFGTRTFTTMIWEGANMGRFLRWGNWAVAKLMEALFNTTSLSDVGCTMRMIHRPALDRISPWFTVGGSFFGPEMMLLAVHKGLRTVQIPVNYHPRVGQSQVTGDLRKAFVLGLQMIWLIVSFRLASWFRRDGRYGHQPLPRRRLAPDT